MTLLEQLRQYDKTMIPFHMPGHKRNTDLSGENGYLKKLGADCDITEIAGFDNLAEAEGILLGLKERAARLWHSDSTELLVNGSTVGILAAIYAAVPRGGTVIAARNCHKSVFHGLTLVQANTVYLMPETDKITGICGPIRAEQVQEALQEHPEAALVILTSPTYEGVVSDLQTISDTVHAAGVPLLVDSAHGAHYGFGAFPKSAVDQGADLVVQSIHKTLPSLTQTALLHYKKCSGLKREREDRITSERLRTALNLFQTSSPSYLLLSSIDGCIDLLEKKGEQLFQKWTENLDWFLKESEGLRHLKVLSLREDVDREGYNDKLLLSTAESSLTGQQLSDRLRREYRLELEMSAERYCIAMTGPGDTREMLQHLKTALYEIDATLEKKKREAYVPVPKPQIVLPLFRAGELAWEECPMADAEGRVAAETVFAYPPGIPILAMGERITKEILEVLWQKEGAGIRLHGENRELLDTLRVLEDRSL